MIIKTFTKSYEQPLSEHLQNCETLHNIVSLIFHNLLRYDITDLSISGEVQIKDGPLTTGWYKPGSHQRQDVSPMLIWCWANVVDDGPTSNQHWVNVFLFAGITVQAFHQRFPANSWRPPNVYLMLGQRRRRWSSIKSTLVQCVSCFSGSVQLRPDWVEEGVSL